MAENKMKYNGNKLKRHTGEDLPSVIPSLSGNMAPTSFDAMNSREWVRGRE